MDMDNEFKVGIVGFWGAGLAQYNHFQSIKGCKIVLREWELNFSYKAAII